MTTTLWINRIARFVFLRSPAHQLPPHSATRKLDWQWVEDGVDWAHAVELAAQQSPCMSLTTSCRTCGLKCLHEIHNLGIKNFRAGHLVSALECGHQFISSVRTRFHLPAIQVTDQSSPNCVRGHRGVRTRPV